MIPHDILISIFSQLSYNDVCNRCKLTCKSWREAACSNILWENLFEKHVGLQNVHHSARSPVNVGWFKCFKTFFQYQSINFEIDMSHEDPDCGRVVEIKIDGVTLSEIIDERGKEIYQQYVNKQDPNKPKEDIMDYDSVKVQSTYGGFLISHLNDIRSETKRNNYLETEYELFPFGQGCICCPHVYFIVQVHNKFVWWEGPFEWHIEENTKYPRFHFYFEKTQYVQALAKLSKAYDAVCGENFLVAVDLQDPDDLSDDFRSASFAAEEYEIRATDPLPQHERFSYAKHSNAPYKKGNRTYVNRKVLQSKKKEIAKHQMNESQRKKDVKLSHARKDKESEHKI